MLITEDKKGLGHNSCPNDGAHILIGEKKQQKKKKKKPVMAISRDNDNTRARCKAYR